MEENLFIRKRKFYEVDPRIRFIVGLFGGIGLLFIQNEVPLFIGFVFALLWCIYCGKWKNALSFGIVYGLLFWWYLALMSAEEVSGLVVSVVLFRRFLLIGAFLTPLISVETGALVASMHKMKLPKFAIMSMAILFRFIPTLKDEYRAVRTSQKFRGIGRSIINVILHPITFYETLIVPLAIRIMKISDELSASAMLRGADKKEKGTCFREVRVSVLDYLMLVAFLLVMTLCIMLNYNIMGVGL